MAFHSRTILELPEPHAPRAVFRPAQRPLFCYGLIASCVAVTVADTFLSAPDEVPLGIRYGALFGPAVSQGQWWRLLTTVLVHGGALHLFFNMSAVWNLGRGVELRLGTLRFTVLSLVGALGSGLFALHLSYDVPTVGASGMILAWAGALLPLAPSTVRSNLWVSLFLIAAISLLPGISWQGHLGGFLFGGVMGLALRKGGRPFWLAAAVLTAFSVAAVPLAKPRAAFNAPP